MLHSKMKMSMLILVRQKSVKCVHTRNMYTPHTTHHEPQTHTYIIMGTCRASAIYMALRILKLYKPGRLHPMAPHTLQMYGFSYIRTAASTLYIQGVTLQDKPPQSHRNPEAYQVSPG